MTGERTTLQERVNFLQIDAQTSAALVEFKPQVAGALNGVLDRFYAHILKLPHLAKLLAADAIKAHAQNAQEASAGTSEVSSNIVHVTQTAKETGETARLMQDNSSAWSINRPRCAAKSTNCLPASAPLKTSP